MKLEKVKNSYGTYDIRFIQDGKILDISQVGADILLSCRYENFSQISAIQFDITSDDQELFQKFNRLYENIIEGNVCGWKKNDPSAIEYMKTMKNSS